VTNATWKSTIWHERIAFSCHHLILIYGPGVLVHCITVYDTKVIHQSGHKGPKMIQKLPYFCHYGKTSFKAHHECNISNFYMNNIYICRSFTNIPLLNKKYIFKLFTFRDIRHLRVFIWRGHIRNSGNVIMLVYMYPKNRYYIYAATLKIKCCKVV